MANFNTYQTRQLYVAKSYVELSGDDAGSLSNVGDVGVKVFENALNKQAQIQYINANGTRIASDIIPLKNVVSLRLTEADDMNIKLIEHVITVNSEITLTNYVGKVFTLTVKCREFMSYDPASDITVVASFVGNATNTANAAAFNKAVAKALVTAIPKFAGEKPFKVTINDIEITKDLADGSYPGSGSLKIVEAAQHWVRGKMAKEAFPLTISSSVEGEYWAVDTPAPSDSEFIPSAYQLADLEAFAIGERADYIRYGNEPDYEPPTYMIDVAKKYDVLNIEYFWQGGAENVQKSPRMIQIACEVSGEGSQAASDAATIYGVLADAIGLTSAASGTGDS